jgi:predicted nucleic acid-binding Zn ribbon protein
MFKRREQMVMDIVNQCLRQNGLETPMRQVRLIGAWERVAGKAVARHTGEKFIRNQTLFVKLGVPALRSELSMRRSELVRLLNQEAGATIITEIKFF